MTAPAHDTRPAAAIRDELDAVVEEILADTRTLRQDRDAALAKVAKVESMLPELLAFLGVVERTAIGPVRRQADRWRRWLAPLLPDENDHGGEA